MPVRAPSEARNTNPRSAVVGRLRMGAVAVPAVLAVVVPLAVVGQADASSSTPSRAGAPTGRVVTAGTSTPHALPPRVHDVVVPAVPAAQRAKLAQRSAPRRAVTAQPAQGGKQAKPAQLVGHVRSRIASGFSMLGVTWDHGTVDASTVQVAVRTHARSGWTPWTAVDVDPDEGPAPGEDSSVRDGTAPLYVGQADAVEVDVYDASGQRPAGLTVAAIDPGTSGYDATAATSAAPGSSAKGGTTTTSGAAKDGLPSMPRIVTRKQWGANESLGDTCWSPRFGSTFKAVFVHHTAGSNTYTRRESASIVRGIYAYHTQSRGWCDIGYNFLIDRYGTVYEGRAGGIRKPVRGAHSGDYNVNSTGISLMGEFTNTMPTQAMRSALVRLVAWRLGTAYRSGVGSAYINGKRFAQISGHRDAMATACPGQMVYDWLPTLRRKVHKRLDQFSSVIERHWLHRGGAKGALGQVRMGEVAADGGRHTTFTKARSYFKNGRRVTLYTTPLLTAYLATGETSGELGYPRSRLHRPAKGLSGVFEGGRLYWSAKTDAHVVLSGKVLVRYRHLHGPAGKLGFPKTDLLNTKAGSSARFQRGTITYDKSTGRTTVSYR